MNDVSCIKVYRKQWTPDGKTKIIDVNTIEVEIIEKPKDEPWLSQESYEYPLATYPDAQERSLITEFPRHIEPTLLIDNALISKIDQCYKELIDMKMQQDHEIVMRHKTMLSVISMIITTIVASIIVYYFSFALR